MTRDVEITTENGSVIRARAAVFATNSPTNNIVTVHSKQVPNRTYVIAGRVPKGSVPDALIWDTYEAYHYVRIQELSETEDLLIVGGEDHRAGEADDAAQRFSRLSGGRANAIRILARANTAGRVRCSSQWTSCPFRAATPEAATSTSTPAIQAKASPMASQAA